MRIVGSVTLSCPVCVAAIEFPIVLVGMDFENNFGQVSGNYLRAEFEKAVVKHQCSNEKV